MAHTQPSTTHNLPLCHGVSLANVFSVLPADLVTNALTEAGVQQKRKRALDLRCIFWLTIAMHLYPRMGLRDILGLLAHTARLRRDASGRVPTDGAICYRRKQLSIRPLVALFRTLARPVATPETPGAFWGSYRLVALDGTTFTLANTPANRRAFGAPSNLPEAGTDPPLRSATPLGVIQEFYALLVAHYVVRALMHASASEADLDPDRLSFTHAVRVLHWYLPDCQRARVMKKHRLKFPPKKPEHKGGKCRPYTETIRLI